MHWAAATMTNESHTQEFMYNIPGHTFLVPQPLKMALDFLDIYVLTPGLLALAS